MAATRLQRAEDRAAAILTDPNGYFQAARARAWAAARIEIDNEPAEKAWRRRQNRPYANILPNRLRTTP